ncbi:MAG: hypothetical protein JHD35_14870 [Sphingopyxis sp.]|nr:hypothetical protein [Sphingopyxis sp.]
MSHVAQCGTSPTALAYVNSQSGSFGISFGVAQCFEPEASAGKPTSVKWVTRTGRLCDTADIDLSKSHCAADLDYVLRHKRGEEAAKKLHAVSRAKHVGHLARTFHRDQLSTCPP